MSAGLCFLRMAHKAVNATLVHRAQAVYLQKRTLLVLDKYQLGQQQAQPRKSRHHVIGRLGVFRIEAVEGKEYRRKAFILAYHIGFAKRCQGNAAAQPHIAYGMFFVVVHELVGEALLQDTEGVDDIGGKRHRARIELSHGWLRPRAASWPDPTAAASLPCSALQCAGPGPKRRLP